MRTPRFLFASVVAISLPLVANAQWTKQTFQLRAGWNSVFLELEPFPPQCSLQFDGKLGIEAVWAYNDRFSPVQITNASDLNLPTFEDPKWHFYAPNGSPHAAASNLYILEEGRCYLIHCTKEVVWTITGAPRLWDRVWIPDSLNLRGFYVDPTNRPTFASYFASSTAHQNAQVFQLQSNEWSSIPLSTRINSGEAYWVSCQGPSNFAGPVRIQLDAGTSLEFGIEIVEHALDFKKEGHGTATISLSRLNSLAPPAGLPPTEFPALAGQVELDYYKFGGNVFDWVPLPSDPTQASLNIGGILTPLRVAVARSRMAAPYSGPQPALYQSILQIKNGLGYRRLVGVNSEGLDRTVAKAEKDAIPTNPNAGLWVGNISIDKVTAPTGEFDDLQPVPEPFPLRIILHLDASGKVLLLKRVTRMWKDAITRPADDGSGNEVIETSGEYVLVTPTAPQTLVDDLKPGSESDERPFAWSVTTTAYSLMTESGVPEEKEMDQTGEFGKQGATLRTRTPEIIEAKEPENPFRHQFHPLHHEGYRITRDITLAFSALQPDDYIRVPGWGNTQLGGTYSEIITGLRMNSQGGDPRIVVQGSFRLQRVSSIAKLNDGIGM